MSYLRDFRKCITNHDYPSFLKIWEEYCSGDELDTEEATLILKDVKNSSFCESFGKDIGLVLPLWETVTDSAQSHALFSLIVDIYSNRDLAMGERVFNYLQSLYGSDKHFQDKIRLIGFRDKENFQGSISRYELLSHIDKGKFVFHTAGWGVGIVLDYSLIREQITLEFDYVPGKKDLSFKMALNTLYPLPDDHFLAQRFGNPDAFEAKAKKEPVEVIRILLRDLGPKTAADIKDELCDLVIPEEEWTKWWQNARVKIKKDTFIDTPTDLKSPFTLRSSEIKHEDTLQKALQNKPDADTLIQMVYSFMKDFSETLKDETFRQDLINKINDILLYPEVTYTQKLQIFFSLQDLGEQGKEEEIKNFVCSINSGKGLMNLLSGVQILSFKKRILVDLRRFHSDWKSLLLEIFLSLDQNTLRDYTLNELLSSKEEESNVSHKLEELLMHPARYPEAVVWYFQKVMGQKNLPFVDKKGRIRFFEALLILLSQIDTNPKYKELVKKIQSLISSGRYAVVRNIMDEASQEEVKEFLLLSTKCQALTDHDIKIFHSLAEVAHPSLAKGKKKTQDQQDDSHEIWTTEQGYLKLQQRIQQIGTVETVENAKEIEIARAHGDLRENAEFKAALEKRDRLQSELKTLSDQINQMRVLSAQDISTTSVGIGTIVSCSNKQGETVIYTLLGPWDADPSKNIIAFQSKLAQTMKGLTVGETFACQGDTLTITDISAYPL